MPFDPAPIPPAARPAAGIAVMLASVLLFSLNDVLGK